MLPRNYYYNLTPLIKLPLSITQKFTYCSPFFLNPGDLVEIEFRKSKVKGVVLEPTVPTSQIKKKAKPILKVIEKKILSDRQLICLEKLSTYYYSPFSNFLKIAVPKIIHPRFKKESEDSYLGSQKFWISPQALKEAKKILKSLENRKEFLLLKKDRLSIYLYLISQFLRKNQNRQILFLVPDQIMLQGYGKKLTSILGRKKISILDKNKSGGDYFTNWQKIRANKTPLILGTRSSVFANFNKLQLILVEEAHDQSYKQWDQNPRYDTKKVVEILSKLHKCPLIWGTNCPSVDFFFKFKHRKDSGLIKSLTKTKVFFLDSGLKIKNSRANFIINSKENNNFNLSKIFSEPIIKKAQKILAKNNSIFIVKTQKGNFSCYFCKDCGFIPQCSECNRNLFVTRANFLTCPVCRKKTIIPEKCPHCGSPLLKNVGPGIEKIKNEVKKIFPQTETLIEKEKSSFSEIDLAKILTGRGIIFIGTSNLARLVKFNPWMKLLIQLDNDKLLFLPDYNAGEKKYQEIAQNTSHYYPVFVQSKYPQHETTLLALKNDYLKFYQKELFFRKEAKLPPFKKIIKFTSRESSPKEAQNKLLRLKEILEKNKKSEAIIEGPYPNYLEKKRGQYFFNLILKLPLSYKKDLLISLETLTYAEKNKIIIDREPSGLI